MILKGYEDLRVVRTIENIKHAFGDLICEKEYEKITVKELCDRARINKKTFYHYYETLDALLAEMQTEYSSAYVDLVKDYVLPDELDKVNRVFFEFSASQGLAYEKITCSGGYNAVRQEMIDQVMQNTWAKSEKFKRLPPYEQRMLINFIKISVIGIYRQWVAEGKQLPLEELIRLSNALVCKGTEGFLSQIK